MGDGKKDERESVWAGLLKPSKAKRILFFLISDTFLIVSALVFAIFIRFEFTIPAEYWKKFGLWALILVAARVGFKILFKVYNVNWRFVGLFDLKNMAKVFFMSAFFIFSINFWMGLQNSSFFISRGVLVIETLLSFFLLVFLLISKRLFYSFFRGESGRPTMIVGANSLGDRLIIEMLRDKNAALYPLVVVDRNMSRDGTRIHGIPVVSGYKRIPQIIEKYQIKTVLINLRPDERKEIRDVIDEVHASDVVDVRVVPAVDECDGDLFRAKGFKQLDIEDLLAREPVQIDTQGVMGFICGKTVLVTGAGGSIGSEVVRKLVEFRARVVVAYEIDETELFYLQNEISGLNNCQTKFVSVLGDVRDEGKLEETFARHKPELVFHASAYKHVPILEEFPEEGCKTNIIGTYNLVACAVRHGCKKLVNISTDKAVNPSSVMGATKRMAESVCRAMNSEETRTISVRFGNVLGSRGSVIPTFLDQIRKGGPVTVTHRDMVRYFMSIPEAVLLVMQASCMGNGGEIFVLDMGEPVRISFLAENLIRMNGFTPGKDIEIVYTGIRPGEKLYEELLTAEEGVNKTTHDKVFVAKQKVVMSYEEMIQMISQLRSSCQDPNKVKDIIKKHVQFSKTTCA